MIVNSKVFVVTGGGSGIGRALVHALVGRGARVSAVDMREEALNETWDLAGENKDRICLHLLNVSDRSAVDSLPASVMERHGAVDGLINNAGIIQPFVKINDLGHDDIERVLNYNLYGQIFMTKAFLPILLERPEAHIVNVSSMGGFFPVPGQSLYGASKAAVKLLSEGLFAELLETNVKVTVVFPGAVDTDIARNSGVVMDLQDEAGTQSFSPLSPKVAAQTIIDGMERDKFQVYIGRDARMMNILYRINPHWATNFMFKQMKGLLPN